jgi:co-chaperonin GroES (HSP10)
VSSPEDGVPGAEREQLGVRTSVGAFGYQMSGNKVLVQKVTKNARTASGLHLPQSAVDANAGRSSILGIVVAIGPGRMIIDNESGDDWNGGRRVKPGYVAGDTVILARWGGHTGVYGLDDSYAICTEGDILCRIDGVDVSAEEGRPVAEAELIVGTSEPAFSYGANTGYDAPSA